MNESVTMEPIWRTVIWALNVEEQAGVNYPMCGKGDFQRSLEGGKRALIQGRRICFYSRERRDAFFKHPSNKLSKVENDGETAYLIRYFQTNPTLADG